MESPDPMLPGFLLSDASDLVLGISDGDSRIKLASTAYDW